MSQNDGGFSTGSSGQQDKPKNNPTGPGNLGSGQRGPFRKLPAGGFEGPVQDFMESMDGFCKSMGEMGGAMKYSVLPIVDGTLRIKCLAVIGEVGGALYQYTLLLGVTAPELPDANVTLAQPGEQYVIPTPKCQYYDQTLVNVVTNRVKTKYSNDNIVSVGGCLVPDSANISDRGVAVKYFNTAMAAIAEAYTYKTTGVTSTLTVNDIIASEGNRSSTLNMSYSIDPNGTTATTDGITANQVHAVISLEETRGGVAQSVHDTNPSVIIGAADMAVDYAVVPRQPDNASHMGFGQTIDKAFVPLIVVTSNDPLSGDSEFSFTGNISTVMSLIAASAIGTPSTMTAIINAFENAPGGRASIGHLNLIANVGGQPGKKPVPFKVAKLGAQPQGNAVELANIMSTLFIPNAAIYAFDIVHVGAQSSQQWDLVRNPKKIHADLKHFTGGVWNDFNTPLTSGASSIVFKGHYMRPDGQVCSLDSLALPDVLKISNGDHELVQTFLRSRSAGVTDRHELGRIYKMYKQLVPNMEVTGIATRVFVNNNFIAKVIAVLQNCQLSINTKGLLYATVGTNDYQQFSMNDVAGNPNAGQLFNTMGTPGMSGAGNPFYNVTI